MTRHGGGGRPVVGCPHGCAGTGGHATHACQDCARDISAGLQCPTGSVPRLGRAAVPSFRHSPKPGRSRRPDCGARAGGEHETAESTVKGASGSGGVGTIVQLAPFHRSARATVVPEASLVVPTATQLFALAQETPASEPPLPAGEGSRCQALPSHRSTSGKASAAPPSWKPTAVCSHLSRRRTPRQAPPRRRRVPAGGAGRSMPCRSSWQRLRSDWRDR